MKLLNIFRQNENRTQFLRRAKTGFRDITPHHFCDSHKSGAGFTLIEILVVAGLFALILAFSSIIGIDSIGRSSVHNERDLVVQMLTGARARALANIDQKPQGVRIEADQIVLFEGTPPGTNQRSTPRNSAITINIDPSINPINIVFEQLSGNVSSGAGTLTLIQGQQTDTIYINDEGQIEW